MKIFKSLFLSIIFLAIALPADSQSMRKKHKTVKVEMKINAPAQRVWEAMVLEYGEVVNFSPFIFSSHYLNGYNKGELGAERKSEFNEKGTCWVHEKIADIDEEKMIMKNVILDGRKIPLNFDNSQAFYQVIDHGDGTCTASYEFQFRTKPAILGNFIKNDFKKQLGGTLIGLKHYVETGERVTGQNKKYQSIKHNYPEPLVVK